MFKGWNEILCDIITGYLKDGFSSFRGYTKGLYGGSPTEQYWFFRDSSSSKKLKLGVNFDVKNLNLENNTKIRNENVEKLQRALPR